jgi:hypothetical protein
MREAYVILSRKGSLGKEDRMRWWRFLLIAALATGIVGAGSCGGGQPPSEALVYEGPIELAVNAGSTIPGSDVKYVGETDKGAELLIGGQSAYKQKADSVSWSGSPLPDVKLDYTLRIAWFTKEQVYLVGTAKTTIANASPQAITSWPASPIEFRAAINYTVGRGHKIPGTPVEYLGKEEQGAKIGGIEGYPYRQTFDSILWEGQLKDGVFIKLEVRALNYTAENLTVAGFATIGIKP